MSDPDGPILLREALALSDDSVVCDACIQGFEFTFETPWKAIHADALAEGVDCAAPRSRLRSAFRIGILERDEPLCLKMVEDRNRTFHVYHEDLAQEIRAALPGYAEQFRQLLSTLKDREKLEIEKTRRDRDNEAVVAPCLRCIDAGRQVSQTLPLAAQFHSFRPSSLLLRQEGLNNQ